MKAFRLLLSATLVFISAQSLLAQTDPGEVRFEGQVTEIFPKEPRGFRLAEPDPVPLASDVTLQDEAGQPLDLSALSVRVLDARDQIRVRIRLNDREQITHLTVVGQDVPAPTDLQADEKSTTLFFVDVENRSITPTGFTFVAIVATTLDTRGTQIFDQDEVRIGLNNLQPGTIVEVVGTVEGAQVLAREVRVLQVIENLRFGNVIVRIERESATRGTLFFSREHPERIDPRAPVLLDGENLGTGLEALFDLLNSTDEPITITLSNQNFFESDGRWGQVDVEQGRTFFGKFWQENEVTFQIGGDLEETLDFEDNRIIPLPAILPVDEQTEFFIDDNEATFDELTEFMYVGINIDLAGSEVVFTRINVHERPRDVTFTLPVGWFDDFNNRLQFNTGSNIRISPGTRFLDLFDNPVGPREFEDSQWQNDPPLVALVTLDPVTELATEARLVQQGTEPGTDQVIVGEIAGIHRGFWVDSSRNEMGTHGLDAELLSDTIIQDRDGMIVSTALLNRGVEIEALAIVSSNRLFLIEITVLSEFEPFEITGRIRFFDLEGHRIEFEEPPPIEVSPDAEVRDHFGDLASMGFLSELLQQTDLQLLLTEGTGPDGRTTIVRVEAFRPDAEVPVGPGQELIAGGRINPFAFPPQIFPQSVQQVRFGDDTEIVDASGAPLSPSDLEATIRVRVTGQSLAVTDGDPFGPKRNYLAQRIEVLGGAATSYRGTLSSVEGNRLLFEAPRPLVVTGRTDLQEETGFRIDFLTLAARIRSEGGLRLELGADFFSPGNPQVWWARILRADEPPPSNLPPDIIVAVFVEADEATRTLTQVPIPDIELDNNTEITGPDGNPLAVESLIAGARVLVFAEQRNGVPVAAEIRVEDIPVSFELTSRVDFIDSFNRELYFDTPPFITVAQDAQILDLDGNIIDMQALRNLLFQIQDPLLRITPSPDSPQDAPIATLIEVLRSDAPPEVSGDQFFVLIDDPSFRIQPFDRRIEPTPFPPAEILEDAQILGIDGNPIDLNQIASGSQVRVKLQTGQGRLIASEILVVGGETFSGDEVIGTVDVANRLISPEVDPPISIDPRAFIGDTSGRRITLNLLVDFLIRQPDLLVAIQLNPFGPGASALQLIDQDFRRTENRDEIFVEAFLLDIDVQGLQIVFKPQQPGLVAEDAQILGANGETLTLADLQPGQRAFFRGEVLGEEIRITSITLIPDIDEIRIVPNIGDFDEQGVDNDVQIEIVTQNGNPVNLPVRLFIDFSPPVETRTGHIFNNLSPGPHVVEVEVPTVGLFARERVFISALGTAFRVTETSPQADATGVAQTVSITVTFNEPLRQFGDFISVSGSLNPPPTSGDLGRQLELINDGKILQFKNVELADNTDYTLSIDAATSRAGNILSQPVLIQFSTGTTLTQLGSLAGSVSVSGGEQFVGTVRLFNEQGEALISVPLDAEGRFSLTAVFEGTYRLSAEVQAEDGRTLSAFLDDDGDGTPDDVTLSAGQNLDNLAFVLSLPAVVQPGDSGVNKDASVVLDLDTRSGNQSLDNLKALPDSEIRVAVYAKDVVNLIGFSVSFTYDTTSVSFQGIDENTTSENNLLRKNSGLAVTLPPTVQGGNVEYNGAILGATELTVVSGDGLLGIFRFKTKRNFTDKTEFQVPRIRLESSGQTDNLSVLARATLEQATTRILMTLTAEPETIPANGTTTIQVDLKDVAGATVTEDTQVRFAVTAGNATLEPDEVTASNGTAQIQLTGGGTAGTVTVSVTAEGSTEQISLVLTETTDGTGTPSEGINLPSGPRGPIALDVNTEAGDQAKAQTTTSIRSGDQIAIDIVAVSGANGNIGFQVILTYDETQLQFDGFDTKDLWLAGVPIVPPASGGEAQIQVALLGQTTSKDAGSMGHAKFTVLSGFTGTTKVEIKSASFDTPVEVGTGGSFVVIGSGSGSVVPADPIEASDIDGDGQVGFSDFLSFAQGFGRDNTSSDFNPRLDLDGDGNIGFSDFISFAQNFGKSVGG